jgi:hypothetical protein
MRSAFRELPPPRKGVRISLGNGEGLAVEEVSMSAESVKISIKGDGEVAFDCELLADEAASYPKWKLLPPVTVDGPKGRLEMSDLDPDMPVTHKILLDLIKEVLERQRARPAGTLPGFLVFSPENSALRTFQSEGQILPLGIRGEGLFAHLRALDTEKNRPSLVKIRETLTLIDWYESFDIPDDLGPGERSIRIHDRFLPEGSLFDQRSANEGFLFLLFYVTLLVSPDAPAFFSIDNVDSSLNPKLCIALLQQIVALAKECDKQVILTTHNPAVLDGIDLHDDEQRLLVVERNKLGHTRVRRVDPPKTSAGQAPVTLSEAFMRGYIGGLPKNF